MRVSIGGKAYTFMSDEGHSHVYNAAALVDTLLNDSIGSSLKNDLKDESHCLMLVAMQLASMLLKQQDIAQHNHKAYEHVRQWAESYNDQLSTFLSVQDA